MKEKPYEIALTGNRLNLRTSFFTAEMGSVLHSGIYNRELTSSLAAGAVIVIAGFFVASGVKLHLVHFFGILASFAVLFLLLRTFVFRDPMLETVFDKDAGRITILRRGVVGSRKSEYPLERLEDIRERTLSLSPENPDGIKMVEHIALQHFTVIPGFGRTSVFNTVELVFRGGAEVMICSSQDASSSGELTEQLKNFVKR